MWCWAKFLDWMAPHTAQQEAACRNEACMAFSSALLFVRAGTVFCNQAYKECCHTYCECSATPVRPSKKHLRQREGAHFITHSMRRRMMSDWQVEMCDDNSVSEFLVVFTGPKGSECCVL
jgi:hypothetical protein